MSILCSTIYQYNLDVISQHNLNRQRKFTGNKQRHLSTAELGSWLKPFPISPQTKETCSLQNQKGKKQKRMTTNKVSVSLPHFLPSCFSDCFTEIAREL